MKHTLRVAGLRMQFLGGKPVVIPWPSGTRVLGMRGNEIVFAVPAESSGEAEYTFWAVPTKGEIDLPWEFAEMGAPVYLESTSIAQHSLADFHIFYTVRNKVTAMRYFGGTVERTISDDLTPAEQADQERIRAM